MEMRFFTIPNLLTLANLACGAAAVVAALQWGDLRTAFWLVAAAAVLDFFDGFAARLLRQYSELGRQLDSLCDMVSFGLAPSAVLFTMYGTVGGGAPWGAAVFIITLFSALRLARFNIDAAQAEGFIGLPTPACALFVGAAGWLFASGTFVPTAVAIVTAAVVLAVLLIAPLRMFALKFRDFSWKHNALCYSFLALSATALAIFHIAAIPFIIAGYVAISLVVREK
ncbi:MAG: CDP-diacylglycerol--serine O-phosphatidyltransferase [Rikenellaceae bacterium]|nr:CDP-diacylglycerol--serine O-phosphatidyltransferase [Rikenellaceae bacterium]MCL2691978.1 CDP-diacylglycerol--serine O-phosphatidyltransferase [Rikenellaceae bacterium]